MDLLLDLLQGAGIAAAIGVRPFLATLLVGILAAANLGVDFNGTDLHFLEQWPFLVVVAVMAVGSEFVTRGRAPAGAWLPVSVVYGALESAGSLADRHHSAVLGAAVGVVFAVLGWAATREIFERTRKRLDPAAARALPLYGEAVAVVAAGLSVLFPPLAVLLVIGLLALMFGGRRREGEKYAGLRILR